MTDLISPVISVNKVRKSALAVLDEWLPTYLKHVNDLEDTPMTHYQEPKSHHVLSDPTAYVDDQLPMVAVLSPGVLEADREPGDDAGEYTKRFGVNVLFDLRGTSWDDTADHVGLYATAIAKCFIDQGPGFAEGDVPVYIDEDYVGAFSESGRTLGRGMVRFSVRVPDAMEDGNRPRFVPDAPDYVIPDDQVASEVLVTVQNGREL